MTRHRHSSRAARGFTVIELSVALVIIVLLVSIVAAAAAFAMRGSRSAGEQQVCNNLKLTVEQFKQLHGFLPPLLEDSFSGSLGPVESNKTPKAYTLKDLQVDPHDTSIKPRFSVCSLPYYLVGAADSKTDGVDGPGSTRPLETGKFSMAGKVYASLFDVSKDRGRLFRPSLSVPTKIAMLDRWYVPIADEWKDNQPPPTHSIRYYRWEPSFYGPNDSPPAGKARGDVKNYNMPLFLGDPEANPGLRAARFAIVIAGPDGEIIDDPADSRATPVSAENKDNIVEFGS